MFDKSDVGTYNCTHENRRRYKYINCRCLELTGKGQNNSTYRESRTDCARSYSEARQRLAEVLNIAKHEEVVIKRRGGETFSIVFRKDRKSPFDVPGIDTKSTTNDILSAVRESRERLAEENVED